MTRDQLQRLQGLFGDMQLVLAEALDIDRTPNLRLGASLLEHAPATMAELPGWFATLTREQLDAVWVTAVIECAVAGPCSTRDLAMALLAVRHWPNGPLMGVGVNVPTPDQIEQARRIRPPQASPAPVFDAEPVGETPELKHSPTPREPRGKRTGLTPREARIAERLRAAIPKPGDSVILAEVFDDLSSRNTASTFAMANPHEFRVHKAVTALSKRPARIVTRLTGTPVSDF